jgi:hypothetical protein
VTTLDQVRQGLEARLNTIPDDDLNVYGYVPGAVNPPAAFVGGPTIVDYRSDPEPVLDATFEIALVVSTSDVSSQLQLLPMLERSGTKSIYAAIEADRTLGGLNVDAFVLSAQPFGQQELGGTKYYVASVSVRTLIG